MTDDQFWELIEAARANTNNDDYQIVDAIHRLLMKSSAEDILAFARCFDRHFFASYRTDLWGAAYLMNGGCSDDGFDYFRGWLISQGRAVFETALQDPDSLSDLVPAGAEADFGFENEGMLGVATRAWLEKSGLPRDAYEKYNEAMGDMGGFPALGEFEWSDNEGGMNEQAGQQIYPKLWARFA